MIIQLGVHLFCHKPDSRSATCLRFTWLRLPEHTSNRSACEPDLQNLELNSDCSASAESRNPSLGKLSSDLTSLRRVDSASSVHASSSARSTARRGGGAGARASASCSLWRKVAERVATVFSASVCAFLRKDSDLERMFIWQGGCHGLEEC